jgi:hypothetical protein
MNTQEIKLVRSIERRQKRLNLEMSNILYYIDTSRKWDTPQGIVNPFDAQPQWWSDNVFRQSNIGIQNGKLKLDPNKASEGGYPNHMSP